MSEWRPHHWVALGLAVLPALATAQHQTVVIEQRVTLTDQMTPATARRRALEEAMAEAVRQVVGVRVRSTTISTTTETATGHASDYRSVVQLDAAGRAIEVRSLKEAWETTNSILQFHGIWEVTVAREVGSADPGFTVELTLPVRRYVAAFDDVRRNDELLAAVTTSRAASIVLVSVVGDSATPLLPNDLTGPLSSPAGRPTDLPPADWRHRGLHLRLTRAPDAPRDELLVAVALTRSDIPPFRGRTLLDFQRWLVAIPLSERATAFAPYTVVSR